MNKNLLSFSRLLKFTCILLLLSAPVLLHAQAFKPLITNPFNLVGNGGQQVVAMGDLDGDGDLDMLVANNGGSNGAQFVYYQNIGTKKNPSFAPGVSDPYGIPYIGALLTPTLVDIDGDGDLDIITGNQSGETYFIENKGNSTAPLFDSAVVNAFGIYDVGYLSSQTFADLDGDGDLDCLVGEYYGPMYYFQNTGTATAPNFTVQQTLPYGLTVVGNSPKPKFKDLDGDGDLDLLVGTENGNFSYFQNTGTTTAPVFATAVTNPFGLSALGNIYAAAEIIDLDGDGDLDVMASDNSNVFKYFENTTAPNPAVIANQVFCPSSTGPSIVLRSKAEGTMSGQTIEGNSITLTAPAGKVFTNVVFASYGTPGGTAGNYVIGGCNAANSVEKVLNAAYGNHTFTIFGDNATFGDPCGGTQKRLYVTVEYGDPYTFTWTNDNTLAVSTPASGTGRIPQFTTSNSTNAAITANFSAIPTFNGKTGAAQIFSVTVNPFAKVDAVADQTVCNASNFAGINFTSPTTGGVITYSWTNSDPSIGLGANGTGNIPTFTATNAGNSPVTSTITVTPSFTNGGTTCSGTPITFTVTVNPSALVNAVPSQQVCNGATTSNINFSSSTTGGTITYNWTNNSPSIGLGANGTGDIPAFTAINASDALITATITVTPTLTIGATSCAGTPYDVTILVNPTPKVNSIADQTICNTTSSTVVNFSTPTTGIPVVYTWTNSDPSIGLAASGSGSTIPSFSAINTGTTAKTANVTVLASSQVSGTQTFSYTGAVQTYTVPAGVTSINISALGAGGGSVSGNAGGKGTNMKGDFSVTPGDVLQIVVGGKGNDDSASSGGGGGSGVSKNGTLMIIAGGGAGINGFNNYSGTDAVTTTSGVMGDQNVGSGGTNGANGGSTTYSSVNTSQGGNGWNAGASGSQGPDGVTSVTTKTAGTFGLGGGGGSVGNGVCNCGGGGGGYSGGGSGGINASGGGGGSFNAGTNQVNVAAANSGDGSIVISYGSVGSGACTGTSTSFAITVNPSPSITTASVAPATVGVAYNQALSATGGSGTFSYVITAGALPAGITLSNTGTLNGTTTAAAGTYNFTVTATENGCNLSATKAFALVLNKGTQSLTFNSLPTKTYGDTDFTLNATSNTANAITYSSSNTAVATIVSGNMVHIVGQGTTTITATQASNASYNVASVAQNLTVSTKQITVSANAGQTKVYGSADPVFAYTSTPLVNGDAFSGTLTRTAGENIGTTYAINQGSLTAGANYTITYLPANFSITAKPITVTATAGQSKVYGTADPVFAYTFTPALVSGDAFTGALGRAAGVNIGAYAINQGSLAAGANYTITYNSASFNITAKPIAVTADAKAKVYGSADPALTYTFTPALVSGDAFTGALSRTAGENVGTYAINKNTLALSSNYTLTYTAANLSITPKALTVTADNKTRVQGTANPAFTATYTGFANGDTNAALLTQPVFATTATPASLQGTYPIVVNGATSNNYTITFVNGTLTVTPGTPTSLTLAAAQLFENRPSGTLAGTLSSTSDDPGASFTYTLVPGTGSTDNAAFSISGNQLVTAQSFDFETKNSYSVRVRTTTQYGLFLEQTFTVNVLDVNEAPTLNTIADAALCTTAATQNIALTGISAGPETAQSTVLSVTSNNAALFNSLSVSGTGSTGTLSYQIKSGASGVATITVTVQDNGGTANGGTDTFTRTFNLTIYALPTPSIASDKGDQVSKGETIKLTATGGTGYVWANANGIISGQNTATLTVRPSITTTYTVTATNANGCSQSSSFTITVLSDFAKLKITNLLTPNGDGYNDKWTVENIDLYPNNEVKVFDKAGKLVYSKKGYDNSWDGSFNGSPLAENTYYYIIDFGPNYGKLKGFVTIVRE